MARMMVVNDDHCHEINRCQQILFDIPGRIAFSPNFGRIFSTAEPARQMQFGMKLVF
jgi:hypothetical protein